MGQATTGTWVCLDEFNRIDLEVLSVVAQQMLLVREALLEDTSHFQFFGKYVQLNNELGLFITFNIGYIGRKELPDNLMALMRPIAMVIPEYQLIIENILFSLGFAQAVVLANKISIFYKLLSDQMSNEPYYDFGMRSIKNILDVASDFIRSSTKFNELEIIKTILHDVNYTKLKSND